MAKSSYQRMKQMLSDLRYDQMCVRRARDSYIRAVEAAKRRGERMRELRRELTKKKMIRILRGHNYRKDRV